MLIKKHCEICQKEYFVKPSRAEGSRFCGRTCKGIALGQVVKERNKKVQKTCETCSQIYYVKFSHSETSRFCSKPCYGAWRKTLTGELSPSFRGGGVLRVCEWCDKSYTVTPYQASRSRFCSKACSDKAHSKRMKGRYNPSAYITRRCSWCDIEKKVLKSQARSKSARFHCSRKCQSEARRSNRIELSCEVCGKVKSLLPYEAKNFRYCSRPCKHKAQTETMTGSNNPAWTPKGMFSCETCGKECRISLSNKNRFCSLKCFGKAAAIAYKGERSVVWKGGAELHAKRYKEKHPEKVAEIKARRRARELEAPVIEKVNRKEIIKRDNNTCYICDRLLSPNEITLDHVTPLARGGSHTKDNLRVACKPCNSRKNNKLLGEFVCFIQTGVVLVKVANF